MLKPLTAFSVAAALATQAAIAAPLAARSFSVSQQDAVSTENSGGNFAANIASSLRFSFSSALGAASSSQEKWEGFTEIEDCPEVVDDSKEEADKEEVDNKETSGPEPIYYGF